MLLLKRSTNELDTEIDRKEKVQVKYREWTIGEKEYHPNIKREKQASQLLLSHIKYLYFSHFIFDSKPKLFYSFFSLTLSLKC